MAKETLGRNVTFPIYKEDGTSFHDLVLRKAVVDSVVMSLGDKITGEVYYRDNTLDVTMREYILYKKNPNDENEDAVKYVLVSPPTIVREGMVADNSELKGMTKYSFVFYHPMYILNNIPFSDVAVSNDQESYLSQNKEFSWIGYPDDFIAKLNKNLQQTEWIVEKSTRFPQEKDNVLSEVLSFDNNTIAEALKTCYETWDVPYVIDVVKGEEQSYSEGKRFKVVFGLPSTEIYPLNESEPFVFRMGKGVGLKNNSRTPRNNKIITRISGYGSESNIPYGYPQIIWTGDQTWNYTINNASGMQTIIVGGRTIQAMSYPIYDGIVGGQKVRLIKHPFTRTHLMPTVYSETVDKKVNPLNPNYDPDGEIVDYYDAIATQEYPYVNEIDPSAPSYEIHQFDIKPEMNVSGQDVEIVNAVPLNDDLTPADAWDDTMNDDGNYAQSFFRLDLPILSFDIYACASITEEMYINMRSGACIGCTFNVQVDWEEYKRNFYKEDGTFDPVIHTVSGDGHVRNGEKYPDSSQTAISLIVRKDNETFGTLMPNVYQQPHSGDAFVVLGISLPVEYITTAEETLDNEMKSYMLENNVHYYDYPLKFDEYFLATHTNILTQLKPNAIVHFAFGDIEQPLELYVKQLTIKYGQGVLPQYDITLTDNIEVVLNQIGQVADDVERLSSVISLLRENYSRNVWSEIAKKLSKTANDTAQGIISFARGILFGDGTHGIDEKGNATLNDTTLNSVQTPSYSGTDIVSDKGFKVWEDNEGKSHMMVDYFSARIKAFFASLEIRKIEHSAGNRIESPAGNTLALVKKFDNGGHEVKDKWYARRYTFAGVSFGMPKLVYQVANYFGVWQEDPSATVAFYRCYWTAEDKEDKKAVENNWKIGDQAFCQTFNLRTHDKDGHTMSGYASNKRYWRIVEATGYDTIEGTEYAYIDLSNRPLITLTVDGITKNCKGYETSGGQNLNDAPEAGDDVACLGNQIIYEERGGALQYITYDPNASDPQSLGVPCVKMYSGIGGDADYPYDLERYVIQKQSPRGVFVRADKFEILSASGTGSSTLTCERGAWQSNQFYGHNDIVQHHGSTWLCVVAVGTTTQVEPSESVPTIWQVYARRGASTPQLEVDSANAIVSANYEGKITNISAATGLPTTIEVYVDGEQIPVANWNLANSRIRWYNNWLNLTGQMHTFAFGITVDDVTPSTNSVGVTWEYVPERQITIEGQRTFHPVINPTDIVVHVEFTHNGETKYADATIPMIVQKAAANVQAQYSADNSSWHSPLQANDLYVRYSYDGGTTWTQGTRFVGKSIEFDKAVAHFTTYSDLDDYISDDPPLGYYLCDQDVRLQSVAALYNYNGTLAQVVFSDEVNYLTQSNGVTSGGVTPTSDGHLWNAEPNSEAWTDMGVIQGADGIDGVSVTLDPATVIFEQDEDNTSTFTPSPSSFMATVNVWKGTTPLAPNSYKVAIQSSTNCTATTAGNQITSLTLGQDGQGVYYPSGSVVLGVWLDPTSTSQTPDTTLTFNWAANLLGTWKLSVRDDTMEAVSEQECAIYDENGDIIHVPFSSVFGQSAQNIFASVQGLKGRTGIDIEDGTITLDAERTVVTNDFEVKKVKTIPTESGIQIQIAEGLFQVFGLAGVANWRFGVNAQGQAILSYYNDAGQELYNLGPDGLSTIDNMPERFTAVNSRYYPSSLIGKGGDTTHNIGSNAKIRELLKSSVWEDMFKVRSRGNDLYLYGARKTVTSGGTIYYGRDNLPAEVTYSATATIASIADGKYFTAREDLQNATTGAAVNTVRISSAVGLLVTSLQRIEFEGMTDSAVENTLRGLQMQHYTPYKNDIYDQLAVTDPGWFCNTFPTLSDIRANTIQIYTAILQDMAGNMFTVLQRKVYT